MSNAKAIAVLEILKVTLTAARDTPYPESTEQLIAQNLAGLRAGIQIGIDAIDREIRLLNLCHVTEPLPEPDIAELGAEAALTFDEDQQSS